MRPLFLILALSLVGCASFGKKMKAFLAGGEGEAAKPKQARIKYSEAPNLNANPNEKLYRRVNKDIFEKEGMLEEDSGSLWVMEGQGSYLFSQNLMRVSGDVVNINLDGVPRSSLEKKVEIIKSLLDRTRKQSRALASAPPPPSNTAAQSPAPPSVEGQAQTAPVANAAATAEDKADAEAEQRSSFDVASVPSRIVEKNIDGSYRIKGTQPFMIGHKEYRVIATGVVRPADIKNDAIDASRLVDSKFDIVSVRKETK